MSQEEGRCGGDGRKIEWKLSKINTRVLCRGQNEVISEFRMAAGDVISISGLVMEYTYFPTGLKRDLVTLVWIATRRGKLWDCWRRAGGHSF